MTALYTPWGEQLDRTCPLPEYPRPQLRRDSYLCLNGLWDYTVEDGDEYSRRRSGKILVPFSPESLLSGCDFRLQSGETLWYERTFTLPEGFRRDRVLLHFGAVDQCCRVLVNDRPVGGHEGGYLPFTLDITGALVPGENRLTVAVTDDPEGGVHAFGKQRTDRGGIWYTAQSGIWQTVWLESTADNYVRSLRLTPDFDGKCLRYAVRAEDPAGARVTVLCGGRVVARSWADERGEGVCPIPAEHFRPWSPEDPYLYDLEVTLPSGDRVESYFGMRQFSVMEHRGRPGTGSEPPALLPVGAAGPGLLVRRTVHPACRRGHGMGYSDRPGYGLFHAAQAHQDRAPAVVLSLRPAGDDRLAGHGILLRGMADPDHAGAALSGSAPA